MANKSKDRGRRDREARSVPPRALPTRPPTRRPEAPPPPTPRPTSAPARSASAPRSPSSPPRPAATAVRPTSPPPPRGQSALITPGEFLEGPELDLMEGGPEHRQFPRAKLEVSVAMWIGEADDRRFSATLRSINLSVSGVFLESTFFLPVGTQLDVSFELETGTEPVHARAEVVRSEHPDERTGAGRSGMGLRFQEFFGQTEVTLARLFLARKLHDFAESYLSSSRARGLGSELDRVIDALAAWELSKVTSPADPWRGREG